MNEATQDSYRKLAAHFYAKHLTGVDVTPKRITDALKGIAGQHRPDYWRRLRNALAFDQSEKGYKDAALRINGTKNPLTRDGASGAEAVPAKQKRIKRIDPKDEAKLLDGFIASGDREAYGAVILAKYTGARPVEFKNIVIQGDRVIIEGAKKNEAGDRGADREIVLDPRALEMVKVSLPYLQGEGVTGRVQDRISAAGRRLWPQRKAVPSLYSWRHQLGSDLKASGLDRAEIGYIMGHQSTASVDRYGNRKTATGGGVVPRAADPAAVANVRELHSQPPSAPAEPSANARFAAHDLPQSPAALVEKMQTSSLPVNLKAIERLSMEKSSERQGLSRDDGLKPK
ncbi:MAG: hypothetical protein K2Y02_07835 [Burkholderiaceae bacterium]|nr:hypothetical protein [Burkholderiaceae bacterium]